MLGSLKQLASKRKNTCPQRELALRRAHAGCPVVVLDGPRTRPKGSNRRRIEVAVSAPFSLTRGIRRADTASPAFKKTKLHLCISRPGFGALCFMRVGPS